VDVDTGIALTVAEALKGTKHVYASIKALLDKAQPAVDTVAEAAVAREGVKYVVTGKEVDGKEAKQLLAIILEKLEQQVKPQHLPPPPPPPPAPPHSRRTRRPRPRPRPRRPRRSRAASTR